jgi:hypothetical protein
MSSGNGAYTGESSSVLSHLHTEVTIPEQHAATNMDRKCRIGGYKYDTLGLLGHRI